MEVFIYLLVRNRNDEKEKPLEGKWKFLMNCTDVGDPGWELECLGPTKAGNEKLQLRQSSSSLFLLGICSSLSVISLLLPGHLRCSHCPETCVLSLFIILNVANTFLFISSPLLDPMDYTIHGILQRRPEY